MSKKELEKLLYKTVAEALGVDIEAPATGRRQVTRSRGAAQRKRDTRQPQRAAA